MSRNGITIVNLSVLDASVTLEYSHHTHVDHMDLQLHKNFRLETTSKLSHPEGLDRVLVRATILGKHLFSRVPCPPVDKIPFAMSCNVRKERVCEACATERTGGGRRTPGALGPGVDVSCHNEPGESGPSQHVSRAPAQSRDGG